jgi:hypothetical protein
MRIGIDIDSLVLTKLVTRFPQASAAALSEFTERVGYKVERQAKAGAPVVHGNLRRQIRFIKSSQIAGVVKSFANYSGYVHGAPYWENKMKRKETPFLTDALSSSETFIENEKKKVLPNIIKSI